MSRERGLQGLVISIAVLRCRSQISMSGHTRAWRREACVSNARISSRRVSDKPGFATGVRTEAVVMTETSRSAYAHAA